MSQIRVAHAIGWLGTGGVERRTLAILRGLGSPEYSHLVITPRIVSASARDEMVKAGAEVVELGFETNHIADPRRYVQAARILRRWKPDIVHGAIITEYLLAAVSGTLVAVKHIVIEETSDPLAEGRSPRANLLVRLAAKRSCRVVAISKSTRQYLVSIGIPPRKIELVLNGVHRPDIGSRQTQTSMRSDLGIGPDDLVVGSISRIDNPHKGVTDLISAFAELYAVRSDSHLILVGTGPDVSLVRQRIDALGLAGRVHMVGHQENVGPWYGVMDIFALASLHEGFGLVNAEAMMTGLPVAATRVGGIPEVVSEGETGLLTPAGDVKALGRSLIELASDPVLRTRLGQKGKKRAEQYFSEERYAADIRRLYADVLADRGAT